MISTYYLERTAKDLFERISSIKLNGQEVEIIDKQRDGNKISLLSRRAEGHKRIEHIALYDELGRVITERRSQIDVSENRSLDFRFTFEVVS